MKSKTEVRERDGYTEPLPKRDADGVLLFSDAKELLELATTQLGPVGGIFNLAMVRHTKSEGLHLGYL